MGPTDLEGDQEVAMGIKDVVWKTAMWKIMKKHLGYTKEEMQTFRENPRNEDILEKVPTLMGKTIVVEVVDSHGCNSQHDVGDKFYFDGAALNAATGLIFASNELVYAGVDPNEMRFKRAGCFDVGVQCGGWGRVIVELSVIDRHEA